MVDRKDTVFPRKKVATRVKHRILANCLKAWGGIIITSNRGRTVRLSFVDTCCGSGLYAPDDSDATGNYHLGSAPIGIDVLAELLTYGNSVGGQVAVKALFINENAAELQTLREAIDQRSRTSVPFQTLGHKLEDVVDQVATFCRDHFGFIFIDPYGPSATPFSVVSQLVRMNFADCLINFPYYSIHKWVGWLDSGEREPFLQIIDNLLNGPGWREIARQYRHDKAALEGAILKHYMTQLNELNVGTFALTMDFEDRKRTMYHLVFTSRNTAGLAAAKREFQKGEAYQAALKAELKAAKRCQGLLNFMGSDATPDDPVDVPTLAGEIHERFRGASVPVGEVVRYGLFRPHVLESHVRKAITILKKQQRAYPRGTRYHDVIRFST